MTPTRVIRLSLDINVFVADLLARDKGRSGSACSMLVEAVRAGLCPAGPVQLVTSVPVIENWADVLTRHLGYDPEAAREAAWILQAYAEDGPIGMSPQIVLGGGHVPFASERQMRQAIIEHDKPANRTKLFDEVTDDRHVLLSALAGRADILATSDIDDFTRGPAIRFEREDVILFPLADRLLVIGKPYFVSHWLQAGIVPDSTFVLSDPETFRIVDERGHLPGHR